MSDVRIEYMELESLAEAERNPKRHKLEEIKASIRRFGFVQVPAINETTGRMVAGHGRKEALREMLAAGEPTPKRIEEREGKWYVPVLRGVSFDTDQEAEAYLLADNRLTDIGGYDEAQLIESLEAIKATEGGLTGTGYTPDDLASLVAFCSTGATDGEAGPALDRNTPSERTPRFICICRTVDEVADLKRRLGLPDDPDRVNYNFDELQLENA